MNKDMLRVETDIVIFGGGIAGLWLANRLVAEGFHIVIFENHTLGGQQTRCSQGIIHGGTKYALNAILSSEVQAISDMPRRWRDCLTGSGEIDLSQTKVRSNAHYMWSSAGLGSKITAFFASKALKSKVSAVVPDNRPDAFTSKAFTGSLYELDEFVVDVPSLLSNLIKNLKKQNIQILKTPPSLQWNPPSNHSQECIAFDCPEEQSTIELHAQKFILASGEGNTRVSKALNRDNNPTPLSKMQLRPLQMVLGRASELPEIFAHCIGNNPKPLLTITTHETYTGDKVWYIGGLIAEEGVDQTREELIEATCRAFSTHLPWIELPEDMTWTTHRVNRAEPHQDSGGKPDTVFVSEHQNQFTVWPTKLALAPALADSVLEKLEQSAIIPRCAFSKRIKIPEAEICLPLWDDVFDSH